MTTPTVSAAARAATAASAALAAIPLDAAKVHTSRHRAEIEASVRCACFFCFRTFASASITKWIDAGTTALCPSCGVDAVLGDASGHSIGDRFLRQMHQHHFGARTR